MNEVEFKSLVQQWQSLKERNERDRFYEEKVFPLVMQSVVSRERLEHPQPYTHLILPVGLSPEPLILSIRILLPERIYLLYTKVSEQYLDRIVRDADLRISQVDKDEISDTNVPEIYQKVKAIYEKWGKPERVAVDISGGKKSMVGGCALAGSLIGARLFYVDSKFNREFGKPDPGSERLVILENPYDVFGDLELERAKELFAQKDFVGAQSLLEQLQQETSTPELYKALTLICEAYSGWDDWKIEHALEKMRQTVDTIKRYARLSSDTPLAHWLPRLQAQVHVLERLEEALRILDDKSRAELEVLAQPKLYLPMMATLRAGAIRQEQRGKLDVAALLWYRLIELLSQQRLSCYGLKTSSPEYALTGIDETELLSKYQAVSRTLKVSTTGLLGLPRQISLIDGYILLKALDDPFVRKQDLQAIRGKVDARNKGIFAHGFKPLDQKSYNDFKDLAEKLLAAFRAVEPDQDFCWDDCLFVEAL